MIRTRPWQLNRLLHEVPATVDDARSDPRGPGSDQVLHAERREEFLGPLRHDALRDRGCPLLRRQGDEVGVHEEPQLVPQRGPEEFRREFLGIIEETAIRVRPRDRDRIRPDLSPSVRADDPVRIEERELGVPWDRVDVPAREVVIDGVDLPIFAAEIEVRVLEAHADAMREVDRIPARAGDQEPGAVGLVAASDQDQDFPPRIVEDAIAAEIGVVDVEAVSRDVTTYSYDPVEGLRDG